MLMMKSRRLDCAEAEPSILHNNYRMQSRKDVNYRKILKACGE